MCVGTFTANLSIWSCDIYGVRTTITQFGGRDAVTVRVKVLLSAFNTCLSYELLRKTMEKLKLVASHLSSVFASSSHVTTHAVPTSRRDIPLATTNSDIPDGHALHSSFSHTSTGGDVLIRIVQGGLAVELVSLSTSVSPIRFLFPASVVPTPSLVSWNEQLHLIVLTSVGSLYRIILPIYEDGLLWHEPLRKDWCREWHVRKLGGSEPKIVHVQNSTTIAIGLDGGGFLRLNSDFVDDETYAG